MRLALGVEKQGIILVPDVLKLVAERQAVRLGRRTLDDMHRRLYRKGWRATLVLLAVFYGQRTHQNPTYEIHPYSLRAFR
jgi:hypothetical protein